MTKTLKLLFAFVAAALCFSSCGEDEKDEPKLSDAKQLTTFNFAIPAVSGVVNEQTKQINVEVPAGTDVKTLVPTIVVSDKATVTPASGAQVDFTNPVVYTVKAEDGSTAAYVVTVTVKGDVNPGGNTTVTDPQELNGTIDKHTTLKDLGLPIDYIIDGTLWISGNATLTIEKGVTIAFASSSSAIDVAGDCGLVMKGTKDMPIQFTGVPTNPGSGAWDRIALHSSRKENVWEYVEFINGGSNDEMVAILDEAKVTIKNCTFKGSDSDAIWVNDAVTVLAAENNIFEDNAGYPIVVNDFRTLDTFSDNSFKNNDNEMIRINAYWLEKGNRYTLKNHGIPYFLYYGARAKDSGTTCTIEEGVTFIVKEAESVNFEYETKLIVKGTEKAPVTFKGLADDMYWNGLFLDCSRSESINIENLIVSEGGYEDNSQAIYIANDAKGTMKNVKVSNSNAYGIKLGSRGSDKPQISTENVTFENCKLGNVYDETEYSYWDEEKEEDVEIKPAVLDEMPF
ncbi:MAG: DUF5018 domain-containing protein [Bacteroidales bacterium]|nr:DUF5018 domain-containing protein [Bacteroidales bacterium]